MSRSYRILYIMAFVLFALGVSILGYARLTQSETTAAGQQVANTQNITANNTSSQSVAGITQATAINVPSSLGATPTPLPTITPIGQGGNAAIAQADTTAATDNTTTETTETSDTVAPVSAPAEPTPVPTDAPPPTAVPSPTPEPEPEPELTGPPWLQYLNLFREQGGLEFVDSNDRWSNNAVNHSQYMLANTAATHGETEGASFYSNGGRAAGVNGNIAIAGWSGASDVWSIDFWLSAPFHAVPLLDPHLHTVGYGIFIDTNTALQHGGTIQYKTGLSDHLPEDTVYPITWPKDGGSTWILSHSIEEFPNPLHSCPGYQRPVGPPVIIQLGAGSITPDVSSSRVLRGGSEEVPHCVITEANYTSTNAGLQRSGRVILNTRDAIVLMPATPFKVGESYTIEVTSNGKQYSWSFDVVAPPAPATYGASG